MVKTVRDGLTGELIDITDVQKITETPEFIRLYHIAQLGCAWTIFPDARHKRAGHSLGTYAKTKKYQESLGLDPELSVAGLIHDLPHSAYAHDGETALRFYENRSHDDRLDQIYKIEDVVEENFDFKKVLKIFKRENPQWRVIWERLGTDKQDYVNRDRRFCGFDPVETSGFEKYAKYDEESGLRFPESQAGWMKDFLSSWLRSHQEIYFRKKNLLVQEELIRSIYYGLETGQLKEKTVVEGCDSQVEAELLSAESTYSPHVPSPKKMMESVLKRGGYSAVLTLKKEGMSWRENRGGKSLGVAELCDEEVKTFEKRIEGRKVIDEEIELSRKLGYPVLICRMANWDRMKPRDVPLGDSGTLFSYFPTFRESLKEDAESFYAVRISVEKEKRDYAFRNDLQTIIDTLSITAKLHN